MERRDVLGGQGWVILEDHYGDDLAIVNAARQSFAKRSSVLGVAEEGLINFLMRERHGTPFEMVDFRFNIKAPIFVTREWQRHRIASYNELSGRYTVLPEEFYLPQLEAVRTQVGKPGAYQFNPMDENAAQAVRDVMQTSYDDAWRHYQSLLDQGCAKELARVVLPVGIMTQFTFKVNLRSLLNFLSLRGAPNALYEMREYAVAIESLIDPIVPVTMSAFDQQGRRAP